MTCNGIVYCHFNLSYEVKRLSVKLSHKLAHLVRAISHRHPKDVVYPGSTCSCKTCLFQLRCYRDDAKESLTHEMAELIAT